MGVKCFILFVFCIMSLDIYYLPSVVKSLYAEEDSPFYYINPFEESSREDSEFERTADTSLDITRSFTETPYSSDSPDSPNVSTESSRHYLAEQRVDLALSQKRKKSTELSGESSDHASKRHLASAPCEQLPPSTGSLDGDRSSHTCQQCGKSFRLGLHLRRHLTVHSDASNLTCEICAMRFCLKKELKRHMYLHSVEKALVCPHCGNIYKTILYLKRHHHKTHSSSRSLDCEMCKELFQTEERMSGYSDVKLHLHQPWQRERPLETPFDGTDVKLHLHRPWQRERPLETPFHCRQEFDWTTGFLDSMRFSGNMSGNEARNRSYEFKLPSIYLPRSIVELSRTGCFLDFR